MTPRQIADALKSLHFGGNNREQLKFIGLDRDVARFPAARLQPKG